MKKRWLIRSLFIGLVVLCVVAWVGSLWRSLDIDHSGKTWDEMSVADGRICIQEIVPDFPIMQGWHTTFRSTHWNIWKSEDANSQYHLAGFSLHQSVKIWAVTIPLWFPTLLSVGMLWLLWRKTKAKPIGHAFPIEPAAKSGKTKP